MSGAVRYLRRLVVVAALIAAVVGLGYVWRSSPLASVVADGGPDRGPAPAGRPPKRDRGDFRGDGGLSLGSVDDLVQTMVVGAGALGAVVIIDKVRRRRHPIRR